jgi:hypothetical protein
MEVFLWSSLNEVRISLVEMECPSFLMIVDLWYIQNELKIYCP